MNFIQRLFQTIFGGAAIEAESRQWIMRCGNCGHERSVWEAGGIRAGAAGNPKRRLRCPNCGQTSWHETYKKADPAGDGAAKST